MDNYVLDFKKISDSRGTLVALEENKNIPFDIKRIYYLYSLNDEPRGFHAHKELRQVALCLNGSCDMILDDGINKKTFRFNSRSQGILIEPMVWHEMHNFTKDCVFLVLASDYYNESDYIRDYEQFKILINKNKKATQ